MTVQTPPEPFRRNAFAFNPALVGTAWPATFIIAKAYARQSKQVRVGHGRRAHGATVFAAKVLRVGGGLAQEEVLGERTTGRAFNRLKVAARPDYRSSR